MATSKKSWPPKGYRDCAKPFKFKPTLRDRTYTALREVIDGKTDTLRNIEAQTGLTWGWLRMFALDKPPNPGINQIETLYHYLTGKSL